MSGSTGVEEFLAVSAMETSKHWPLLSMINLMTASSMRDLGTNQRLCCCVKFTITEKQPPTLVPRLRRLQSTLLTGRLGFNELCTRLSSELGDRYILWYIQPKYHRSQLFLIEIFHSSSVITFPSTTSSPSLYRLQNRYFQVLMCPVANTKWDLVPK
jgi:hypothetical protein